MFNHSRLLTILLISIFFLFHMMTPRVFGQSPIKKPNVSGQFYNSGPKQLAQEIQNYITKASVQTEKKVDIVIVPHAGYVYSGHVAAYGFKAVKEHTYSTVVILAPSHFYGFDGISIWEKGGFETPLGVVEVDEAFSKKLLSKHEKFTFDPRAFEREHALEVEIPFLQEIFKNFKIVPVVMGQPTLQVLDQFAAALQELIGEREDVLIVVSTDLSHYHDDTTARKMDNNAMEAIKSLKAEEIYKECHLRTTMEMCGCVPVTAAVLFANKKGLKQVDVLKYANSGDVSGDYDRVVGYTSVVISKGNGSASSSNAGSALSQNQKKRLIEIAQTTLEHFLSTGQVLAVEEKDPRLSETEGAFVTLSKNGRLRGCIGNVLGSGPLYLTVRDMAIASASRDPRFKPVEANELAEMEIEVSVLSKPRRVKNADEIELGKHGVIVSQGPFHQGLFLPQVAEETGWTKEQFLSQLCVQKAGLSADAWKDPKTELEVFTADVFSESDFESPHP